MLAVAALLFGGVAVALGAIPGDDGVIRACYKKGSGKLRVVSSSKKCKKSERVLSWNQEGVQGPQGTEGAPGSVGPAGPAGPAGVSGREVVQGQERVAPPRNPNQFPSGFTSATVSCPAGKLPLGGSFRLGGGIDDLGENLRVMESVPSGVSAWQVRVLNDSTTKTHLFRAVVICVFG